MGFAPNARNNAEPRRIYANHHASRDNQAHTDASVISPDLARGLTAMPITDRHNEEGGGCRTSPSKEVKPLTYHD